MEFSDLNWYDIGVISIIFLSSTFAFVRGFIRTFFSFMTWFGAIGVTVLSYPIVYELLLAEMDNEKMAMAFASIGVFIVVFIILAIIDGFLVDLIDHYRCGVLDRSFGFAFGFFRGFVIVIILFFSIRLVANTIQFDEKNSPSWLKEFREAATHQFLDDATNYTVELLPEDVKNYLNQTAGEAKDVASVMNNQPLQTTVSLTETTRQAIAKMTGLLPEEKILEIYNTRQINLDTATYQQRTVVFRDIYQEYLKAVAEGTIPSDKQLAASEVRIIEGLFKNLGQESRPQAPVVQEKSLNNQKSEQNADEINTLIDEVE